MASFESVQDLGVQAVCPAEDGWGVAVMVDALMTLVVVGRHWGRSW